MFSTGYTIKSSLLVRPASCIAFESPEINHIMICSVVEPSAIAISSHIRFCLGITLELLVRLEFKSRLACSYRDSIFSLTTREKGHHNTPICPEEKKSTWYP